MKTEKKELTLDELKESAAALKSTMDSMDRDIAALMKSPEIIELKNNRAKAMKEYRSLTGRIVTLEIAAQAKKPS